MSTEPFEHELRIEGSDRADTRDAIAAALGDLDPETRIRVDPETGVVHVTTDRDTLEVTDALETAGLTVSGMTG